MCNRPADKSPRSPSCHRRKADLCSERKASGSTAARCLDNTLFAGKKARHNAWNRNIPKPRPHTVFKHLSVHHGVLYLGPNSIKRVAHLNYLNLSSFFSSIFTASFSQKHPPASDNELHIVYWWKKSVELTF